MTGMVRNSGSVFSRAALAVASFLRLGPRMRTALLMLIGVYPFITAYLYLIMPLTPGWDIWQRTLVLVPMMVLTVVFVVVPVVQKRFFWFVTGGRG